MAKRGQKNQGSSGWIWYIILIGIGMAFSPGACMVLAIGMLPTLVSMFVTTGPSSTSRLVTIATFNLAGVFPFVLNVGVGESTLSDVTSDVFSWGVMMGSAGIGTALNYAGPHVAAQVLTGMAATEQRTLTGIRERLVNEWGQEITKSDISS